MKREWGKGLCWWMGLGVESDEEGVGSGFVLMDGSGCGKG